MPGRVVLVVSDVLGQLLLERRFQHLLGQPRQHPIRAHQVQPVGAGLSLDPPMSLRLSA